MMDWDGGEEMKYKIAICDDAEADRKHLSNLVKQWAQSAGLRIPFCGKLPVPVCGGK